MKMDWTPLDVQDKFLKKTSFFEYSVIKRTQNEIVVVIRERPENKECRSLTNMMEEAIYAVHGAVSGHAKILQYDPPNSMMGEHYDWAWLENGTAQWKRATEEELASLGIKSVR